MKNLLRENALSLAATLLFLGSLIGQIVAGHAVYDDEARQHGEHAVTLAEYLKTGAFVEAIFENWESEFLQMGLFVLLTKFLRQKGSSESKRLDGKEEEVDEDPRKHRSDPEAPLPVRLGGIALFVYERSLSIALFTLFFISVVGHAYGGMRLHNADQLRHGGEVVTMIQYLESSQFWFESFQNWQSEFFSVAALVVLSIFLRERGSPQSKPVAKAHGKTEDED